MECDAISNVDMYFGIDYRYSHYEDYVSSPWQLLNPQGVAYSGITAMDFRLKFKTQLSPGETIVMEDGTVITMEDGTPITMEGFTGDEDDYRDFSMSYINCKVKMSDKRFLVRGPYKRSIETYG